MSQDTMTHAHTALREVLTSLGDALGRPTQGKRRLRSGKIDSQLLSIITDNNSDKRMLKIVADTRVTSMRRKLRETSVLSPQETREKAAEFILWSLVSSRTNDIPKSIPKTHHWLPLCYTKAFAIDKDGARGVKVARSFFGKDGKVVKESLVPDLLFAHPRSKEGFYPYHLETFFGQLESVFSLERPDTEEASNDWSNVAMLAFFATQAARNPEPTMGNAEARFHTDHQSQIISDIFAALDNFETPHFSYVFDGMEFMFSPFMPSRMRMLANGVRAAVFALSPERAVIISDRALSSSEAKVTAERNAEAMVRSAARTGQPLYGLSRASKKLSFTPIN